MTATVEHSPIEFTQYRPSSEPLKGGLRQQRKALNL